MATYNVVHTGPTTYIGPAGNVINGFVVQVFIDEFQETHLLNVPSLDTNIVKAEVTKLVDQRKALSNLGQE